MFKSRRKNAYEPATPRMVSISLPDEHHVPSYSTYSEKPRRTSFLQRLMPERRSTATPRVDYQVPSYDAKPRRSRTLSNSVREVEAPKPIRPHPSQGPFIPVMEGQTWIRNDGSRHLVPVGVPSAAFLEAQARQQYTEHNQTHPAPVVKKTHTPTKAQMEGKTGKPGMGVTTMADGRTHIIRMTALSQAGVEDLAEKKPLERSRSTTRGNQERFKDQKSVESLKPVPVNYKKDREPKAEKPKDAKAPLKSAMRKQPANFLPPVLKPALKAREYGDTKAYYSEDEVTRRDHKYTPPKVERYFVKSKAAMEDEEEKRKEAEQQQARGWTSSHYTTPVVRQSHRPHPAAHARSRSSSTSSPEDNIPSQLRQRLAYQNRYVPTTLRPDGIMVEHAVLNWPLIEFALRKYRYQDPLIYFDAGFDPLHPEFPVKAKRGPCMEALTNDEKCMPISDSTYLPSIKIINTKLSRWPIVATSEKNLRVMDIFVMIYRSYSMPLTEEEKRIIGNDTLKKCEKHYLQRCKDGPQLDHIAERKGMLRIDLLRGRRIFKGLQPRLDESYTYELLFDDGY